jgi:hypothetical protein
VQLNRFDDFPFHQAISPLDVPATSDSHFNDGYYFAWYQGDRHWFCGLRVHPNNNVMDGYAGLVAGPEQRSIRFTRALRPRYDHLEVGPFTLEIVEPMQVQRLHLADNDSGVTFDVTVEASAPPFLETPRPHHRHGRLFNHVYRYTQLGRIRGTGSVDGTEQHFEHWHGCRDHSWGIRSTMGPHVPIRGVVQEQVDPRAIRIWIPFEVDDHSGFFHLHEDSAGNVLDFEGRLDLNGGSQVVLASARHSFVYHEGTRRLKAGSFTLTGHDGSERDYRFETSAHPAHPQGFGYTRGWRDGGQPGVYRGAAYHEVDRFRVDDPTRAVGPDHVPEERRLGGTEFASRLEAPGGAAGMAHIEHMIYGEYRPYGFT